MPANRTAHRPANRPANRTTDKPAYHDSVRSTHYAAIDATNRPANRATHNSTDRPAYHGTNRWTCITTQMKPYCASYLNSISIYIILYIWFSVWTSVILSDDISECIVFFVRLCVSVSAPAYWHMYPHVCDFIILNLLCIICIGYMSDCIKFWFFWYLTKISTIDVKDSTVSLYDVVNNGATRFLPIWESCRYLWVCA